MGVIFAQRGRKQPHAKGHARAHAGIPQLFLKPRVSLRVRCDQVPVFFPRAVRGSFAHESRHTSAFLCGVSYPQAQDCEPHKIDLHAYPSYA